MLSKVLKMTGFKMDEAKKNELRQLFPERISFGVPLSGFTSMGVGGPADALLMPSCPHDIEKAIRWCSSNNIFWSILGGGTNLVVMDDGVRGLVIAVTRSFGGFESESLDDVTRVRIKAGTSLSAVCNWAADNGLKGLEFAAGIPGSFGGAVKMNAGTSKGWISDILESVTVVTPSGDIEIIEKDDIEASYRTLKLRNVPGPGDVCGSIIVEATVLLKKGLSSELQAEIKKSMELRKKSQPLGYKNSGCIFRNPENSLPAGKLIEMAGLKGAVSGGAMVSDVHANFIVNTGNASANDILNLMDIVRTTVRDKFSVTLESEVIVAG